MAQERAAVAEAERKLRAREEAVRDREDKVRRRLDAKVDDQLREARKEIDAVIEGLKTRAADALRAGGRPAEERRASPRGRAEHRRHGRRQGRRPRRPRSDRPPGERHANRHRRRRSRPSLGPIDVGSRVTVGALGLEGVVVELHGKHAEVDVRGKRLRAALRDLRMIDAGGSHAAEGGSAVHVNVDLQPRQGLLSELNVIGSTVDEALGAAREVSRRVHRHRSA